mgnify:CR=1 FL=1
MKDLIPTETIEQVILLIRGQKVILDDDLARLYGVTTKRLNEQVKRNRHRFPKDFMFQLNLQEVRDSRSHFATLNAQRVDSQEYIQNSPQITTSKRGQNIKYLPYAFTEHGAIMAANVLNSRRAVQMSVFVVRAFVKMRGAFADTRDLGRKLAEIEKELKGRLDVHEAAIVTVLQRVMDILDPPPPPPPPPPRRIGFRAR